MKKLLISLGMMAGVLFAGTAMADGHGGGADINAGLKGIGAALAIGLAAFGGAFGQGRAAAAALEGSSRNPQASLLPMMIVGLALIESLVILGFLVAGNILK